MEKGPQTRASREVAAGDRPRSTQGLNVETPDRRDVILCKTGGLGQEGPCQTADGQDAMAGLRHLRTSPRSLQAGVVQCSQPADDSIPDAINVASATSGASPATGPRHVAVDTATSEASEATAWRGDALQSPRVRRKRRANYTSFKNLESVGAEADGSDHEFIPVRKRRKAAGPARRRRGAQPSTESE